MPGFRPKASGKSGAPAKPGTAPTKSSGKLHGAGNCGTGKGGFRPGNTCGKSGRAKLAADIRAARASAQDHGGHAALRDKVKALKMNRRGREHAIADEHAGQLRAGLRTGKDARRAKTKAETVAHAHAEVRAAHSVQRARNATEARRNPVHETPKPEPGLANAYRKEIDRRKAEKVADAKLVKERGHELEASEARRSQLREAMFDYSVSARTRKAREKKYKEHEAEYEKLESEVGGAKYRIENGTHDRFIARDQERLDNLIAEHSAQGPNRFDYAKHQADHPDLIAPGTVTERLARYKVGDAKVSAIDKIGTHYEKRDAELAIERTRINREMAGHMDRQAKHIEDDPDLSPATHAKVDAAQKEIDRLADQRDAIRSKQRAIEAEKRADIERILTVDRPARFEASDIPAGFSSSSGPLSPPSAYNREGIARAHAFLGKTVARGDSDAVRVQIGEGPGYRAHHSAHGPDNNQPYIQIKNGEDVSVIVHEYGHAIDRQVIVGGREVNESSQDFLRHRVGNETPVDMHQKFGAGDPGEMGRRDKFEAAMGSEYSAHYTGKDYGRRSSEITSMGMQELYKDPVKFTRADPEYSKHILGLMDGSLR